VVDDDPENREFLEYFMAEQGAIVRSAMGGPEALQLLKTWTPEVLLLDIEMPGMDGYQLLTAIRREPALRKVPAVAITGLGYPADKDRAFSAGFAAHMTKPFDCPALVDLVEWLTSKPPRPA
jgi:two-component system CheB/CheR fusion protein